MKKVELRPAFVWDCDSCGRQNFHAGTINELSHEEKREILEEHGIDTWKLDAGIEDGDFIGMPEQVTCKHCGEEFESYHWGDDEDDEDGDENDEFGLPSNN